MLVFWKCSWNFRGYSYFNKSIKWVNLRSVGGCVGGDWVMDRAPDCHPAFNCMLLSVGEYQFVLEHSWLHDYFCEGVQALFCNVCIYFMLWYEGDVKQTWFDLMPVEVKLHHLQLFKTQI